MSTLMGRPRAGACALWAASCFCGAGLRQGHVSARSPDKAGEAVPLVRQVATCRYTCRCGPYAHCVRALVHCGRFYVVPEADYWYQGSSVIGVRDRREYGFVCGTHRFATLAVLEGGGPRVAG